MSDSGARGIEQQPLLDAMPTPVPANDADAAPFTVLPLRSQSAPAAIPEQPAPEVTSTAPQEMPAPRAPEEPGAQPAPVGKSFGGGTAVAATVVRSNGPQKRVRPRFGAISSSRWQVYLAAVAILISVATTWNSNRLQGRSLAEQSELQSKSMVAERRNALLALLTTAMPNIDLDTTRGRAFYVICLDTALELDSEDGGKRPVRYALMLPRYDETTLRHYFEDQPDILRFVKAHIIQDGTAKSARFFVAVSFYRKIGDESLEREKSRLLASLGRYPKTQEYGVRIMWDAKANARVLVVGGRRGRVAADEVRAEIVLRGVVAGAEVLKAEGLEPYRGKH